VLEAIAKILITRREDASLPKILITRREDGALDFQSGNSREMHYGHFARKPTHVDVV
jgi:hypothetical protein